MINGGGSSPAVTAPDAELVGRARDYPLHSPRAGARAHTILLLAIVLLGLAIFHKKPIWGGLYLCVSVGAHATWMRRSSCTRCPHYGRSCPSLLHAGVLGAHEFEKRPGRWTAADWAILVFSWAFILCVPALYALGTGRVLMGTVSLLFCAGFFLVHNELGCRTCRNAPFCPKGVFAHNSTAGNFLRMIPIAGNRAADAFFPPRPPE